MQTEPTVIILGAGPPFRGAEPSVLHSTSGNGRVLDWLLAAFDFLAVPIHFVSGYGADAVQAQYPQLFYTHNPDWQQSSATCSLLKAPPLKRKADAGEDDPEEAAAALVSYADIVFHQSAAQRLLQSTADISIATDSQWRRRYSGRSEEDLARCEKVHLAGDRVTRLGADIDVELANSEFVGLVHFSPHVMAWLREHNTLLNERFRKAKLADLIEWLRMQGFTVQAVDLAGDWAELNEPRDLAHFVLGTKAQTLQRLQGLVSKSRIEDQVSFTVAEWQQDAAALLSRVGSAFAGQAVVVRSSALSEDGFSTANAGAYTSVLDVTADAPDLLSDAVLRVIGSYPDDNSANQVLVQPMVADVQASGVVFTRTLAHGAPWYVINYDDVSGSTESITSGHGGEHKTFLLRRDCPDALDGPQNVPGVVQLLLPALREIENLLDYDSLDIEFAVSGGQQLHILQVRPIAVDHATGAIDDERIYRALTQAEQRFAQLQQTSPFVQGRRAVFGLMPDWNPAEIIGTRPGRLASSLYRYLIMDETWARQRAEYGYRDVRPQPLLYSFAGHPYVDVRASFNSFIPASLDDALAGRLVDFYMDCLLANPQWHDKVEFNVVPTCYAPGFAHWESRLRENGGFSDAEINALREGLSDISRAALDRNAADLARIDQLEARCEMLQRSDLPLLDKAAMLLADCRAFGTLPFAHLARSAFIAVTWLRSSVEQKIISQAVMDDFLASIRTVSHQLTVDARQCADGALAWDVFVTRYAHLRPGTYDITSPAYGADPERYLRPLLDTAGRAGTGDGESDHAGAPTGAWTKERDAFFTALRDCGLLSAESPGHSAGAPETAPVEQFMREAIEGREYAKFAFSRNLSLALDALTRWGADLGLDAEALSNLDIEELLSLRSGTMAPEDTLASLKVRAEDGAQSCELAARIELPALISDVRDFSRFAYPASQANFIGSTVVSAPCVALDDGGAESGLAGCIVLIPRADPGYDWLFGQGIVGLITLYGGANSHMAIRAAEFGLPAAIGVGESRYQALAAASALNLNPANRQIAIIG